MENNSQEEDGGCKLCKMRVPSPTDGVEIIQAAPQDAKALTQIAFEAKRHWGYPESQIQEWSHLLTIEPRYITTHETHAAIIDGRAIGFYSLKRENAGLHLEHLWVMPVMMRKGVGRALFSNAAGRIKGLGYKSLRIESDPNAAGFYQRMGAQRVGVRMTEIQGVPRELPLFVYEVTANG